MTTGCHSRRRHRRWVGEAQALAHSPDAVVRDKAVAFVRSIMDLAAKFEAPAIIGSMQGRWGDGVTKPEALRYLGHALFKLDTHAADLGTTLLYEPINRYETNLVNTLGDAVTLLSGIGAENVKILADLYHMNIEETNIADAIRKRRPTNRARPLRGLEPPRRRVRATPISANHVSTGRDWLRGYLSAEDTAAADSDTAARQTMAMFRRIVG